MAAGDVKANLTKVRAFNCNAFDGVDDNVVSANISTSEGTLTDNSFTASLWARFYENEANETTLEFHNGSVSSFRMTRTTIGNLGANITTQAGAAVTTGSIAYSYGVWYHCLVTKSPSQIVFYLNGVASTAGDTSVSSDYRALHFIRIGANLSNNAFMRGHIREVKVWNRVLTADEIAADYAGSGPTDGLVHYVKLGGDYTDYGSKSVTFTNTGSVPFIEDDALAAVVKAQRVSSTDKWMVWRGQGGQVGTVNIE